ncbi:hypothetical protein Micbo1qcDRAFT_162216 [Microdochium bolleyi]|uniref:F-box domain-containing protein n=1 Tax=Microdochium bolleyi TaxID=196109 RepID=A0A136J4M0_9PEZI|nr:hypothetical protein Micbo1qcDRAFT_162216 [Microdochium bolleyi]
MRLPPELLLEVFEYLDAASMQDFAASSKAIACLTSQFEKSISTRRTASYGFEPPQTAALCSNKVRRVAIPARTYALIRELEMRQNRTEYMFLRSGFVDLSSPPGMRPLTCSEQLWKLFPLLRRALCLCDRIADMSAHTVQDTTIQISSTPARTIHDDPQASITSTAFTQYAARPSQVALIQSLDLESVSCLLYLLIVLSVGFVEGAGGGTPIQAGNPIEWEQVTIFEESVLRHGSWFLWAHIAGTKNPGGRLHGLKRELMVAGLQELTAWETGKSRVLPGLKMTVLDRFRRLTQPEDGSQQHGHQGTVTHMFDIVRKVVYLGDDA